MSTRTINIFKQLDETIDGLPGLLFQEMVVIPESTPPAVSSQMHTPDEVWAVATKLAYAEPGRVIVAQEHGRTIAAFEADAPEPAFEPTHRLIYDHWKSGPTTVYVRPKAHGLVDEKGRSYFVGKFFDQVFRDGLSIGRGGIVLPINEVE